MKKMIFIMTIDSIADKMHEFLEVNADIYFELSKGKGKYKYYHRMDSQTWPGYVSGFIIPIEEEKIKEFKEKFIENINLISTEHYWSYMVIPIEDFEMFTGGINV
ncbi:MAG: hypothetical protein M0P94_04290 [Candidatus Absconditabacterales bacterium]|nr:hypothetical protein [Candidatus Absconditabacterales bacterium]